MAGEASSSETTPYVVPFVINGNEQRSEETFDLLSPKTGGVVHKCSAASVQDADAAVAAAAEAFQTWRRTSPKQRRDIFLKAADIMDKRRAELARYVAEETSADEGWAQFNLGVSIDNIKDIAGRIATLEGSFPTLQTPETSAIVLKEPYGVILSIAPWNAPYVLATRAVASPIAAGNTVVLKGTELAPRTMWALVSVFQEAGLPKGVLNVIYHKPAAAPAITSALIENPLIKKVNFTGSTAVGRIIGKLAGQNLKPVVLELGGKAPAIVWEDADLELAADQCALGAFMFSGQICMSTERILVHKAVKAEFETKLAASIEKFFSSKDDAPVLINKAGVERNKKLIKDATSKGASLIYGDAEAQEAIPNHMRPAVLSNVTTDMDIYSIESFGPTVSVIGIETEEEAIRISNDTAYGLSSAVFTEDLRRGLRIAREIETGAVHINNMTVHDETALPHGGAKSSGFGRFNTSIGLEEWVRTKNVTFRN